MAREVSEVTTAARERWRLEDERAFLRRSLHDADLEWEAGDLSDIDHRALRHRDAERLAAVEAALARLDQIDQTEPSQAEPSQAEPSQAGRQPAQSAHVDAYTDSRAGSESDRDTEPGRSRALRRRRRNVFAVIGVAAIVAAIVLLIVSLVGPRMPGDPSSGSVNLDSAQQVQRQLTQAAALVNQGDLAGALVLYQEVLQKQPQQPEALAESGWLEYEAGVRTGSSRLIEHGRASVEASIRVQPDGYAGHLYLGTIELQQDHNPGAAVGQFRLFLSEGPPASLVRSADPFLRQAFTQDLQPIPSSVP